MRSASWPTSTFAETFGFHDSEKPLGLLFRKVTEPVVRPLTCNPGLDPELAHWIEWLLQTEVGARPSTALEAWEAFEEIVLRLLGPRWHRQARLLDLASQQPPDPLTEVTPAPALPSAVEPLPAASDTMEATPLEPPPDSRRWRATLIGTSLGWLRDLRRARASPTPEEGDDPTLLSGLLGAAARTGVIPAQQATVGRHCPVHGLCAAGGLARRLDSRPGVHAPARAGQRRAGDRDRARPRCAPTRIRSLASGVPYGGRLDVELRMPGLEIDEPVASPSGADGRRRCIRRPYPRSGRRDHCRHGRDRRRLRPSRTRQVQARDRARRRRAAERAAGEDARRYHFAFISYASKDRDEVLRRVQLLASVGIDYFQDLLSLEPGDR